MQAATRELREETGIQAEACGTFSVIRHTYAHAQVCLRPVRMTWMAGEPAPLEVAEVRWVGSAALRELDMLPGNRALLAEVLQVF